MEKGIVRTILGMDEKTGSMTFAGDLEQGGTARLMKTNIDNLVHGAEEAAKACQSAGAASPKLLQTVQPDFLVIFAQVSRSVTVLLKTGTPGVEHSLSTQK